MNGLEEAPISVAAKIEIEERLSRQLLSARGPISRRKEEAIRGIPLTTAGSYPPQAAQIPQGFISAPISAAIYSLIDAEFVLPPNERVTTCMVSEARAYTSKLLGVDLEAVRVEVVPSHEWDERDTVEGFQISVGVRDHLIFVPDSFSSPVELLCHELAHAGHVTAQRMNGELPYYSNTPITAELVAHFVQYNYLLKHKDRAHFVAALGQLTTATYALAIYASGICDDFVSFFGTDYAKAIRKAMRIEILESTYKRFQANSEYWIQQAQRGISIVLALLLVDEHVGMKRFISADRIDETLESKLRSAFPNLDILTSFEKVNDQIFKLLDRFNGNIYGHSFHRPSLP